MSLTTATVTFLQQPSAATAFPTAFPHTCAQCGADLSHVHLDSASNAQRRISELEAQVKILTGKATAAVDKLADYEDELRLLKSKPNDTPTTTTSRPSSPSTSIPTAAPSRPLHSRFSSLLPSTSANRRSTSQPPSPSQPPSNVSNPTTSTSELLTLLTREQTLRAAAERRVSQTNDELEELSAQLFTEANEMVAVERRARGRLEERVKVLEGREGEKKGRLELLEERVRRIERVRGLLGNGVAIGAAAGTTTGVGTGTGTVDGSTAQSVQES